MDEDQPWHPYYLGNPVYAFLLMVFFEWGVAMHDLEVENIVKGKRKLEENKALHAGIMRKVKRQALKDYLLFPALTGPLFPMTLAGNAVANLVRNVWAFNIIFCGHFPAGVATFSEEECEDESPRALVLPPAARLGQHHRRQALPRDDRQPEPPDRAPPVPGPAGPSLPRDRREVREICERYGLPYNTGPLGKQLFSVARKICRMALPDRKPRTDGPGTARCDRARVGGLSHDGVTLRT